MKKEEEKNTFNFRGIFLLLKIYVIIIGKINSSIHKSI